MASKGPEAIRGMLVDTRSDLYALGCILYEILTHQPLLSGETVSEVTKKLLNEPFPKPSEAAPDRDIPAALEGICCKALEKEAKNRFHDVNEMIEELQDYRAA